MIMGYSSLVQSEVATLVQFIIENAKVLNRSPISTGPNAKETKNTVYQEVLQSIEHIDKTKLSHPSIEANQDSAMNFNVP